MLSARIQYSKSYPKVHNHHVLHLVSFDIYPLFYRLHDQVVDHQERPRLCENICKSRVPGRQRQDFKEQHT